MSSIQEELNQIERTEVWELVPISDDCKVIGTKWVHQNKDNEKGNVVKNKSRIVGKGTFKKKTLILNRFLHRW